MHSKFLYVVTLILLGCSLFYVESRHNAPGRTDWKSFKKFHRKKYENAAKERHHELIFDRKRAAIVAHNKRFALGLETYEKELNKFSDVENEKFAIRLGFKSTYFPKHHRHHHRKHQSKLLGMEANLGEENTPASFDWRDTPGVVGPVQDQGNCGSCWAFSATGALVGQAKLKKNKDVTLSEQQLVSCDSSNWGCAGGNYIKTWYYYTKYTGGISSEVSYPYTSGVTRTNGVCYTENIENILSTTSFQWLPQDETVIQEQLVSIGPLSVAIDASGLSDYSNGVYTCNGEQHINHAVLLVGYGTTENGIPYWICKNQWGQDWGLDGYFYLRRGINACLINYEAAYPILK